MNNDTDHIGITTPFYCTDGKGHFLLHQRSKHCRDEQGKWDTGVKIAMRRFRKELETFKLNR